MPKRRSKVIAPPSFRHTDKKHEQAKRACRDHSEVIIDNYSSSVGYGGWGHDE